MGHARGGGASDAPSDMHDNHQEAHTEDSKRLSKHELYRVKSGDNMPSFCTDMTLLRVVLAMACAPHFIVGSAMQGHKVRVLVCLFIRRSFCEAMRVSWLPDGLWFEIEIIEFGAGVRNAEIKDPVSSSSGSLCATKRSETRTSCSIELRVVGVRWQSVQAGKL